MSKFESFLNFIGHYKYLITGILGLAFCGFLSESSAWKLMQLDMQKEDLQKEIEHYQKQNEESLRQLESLKANPNAVEKVARERYFMKKADEDVFVLSTDEPAQPQSQSEAAVEEIEATPN